MIVCLPKRWHTETSGNFLHVLSSAPSGLHAGVERQSLHPPGRVEKMGQKLEQKMDDVQMLLKHDEVDGRQTGYAERLEERLELKLDAQASELSGMKSKLEGIEQLLRKIGESQSREP